MMPSQPKTVLEFPPGATIYSLFATLQETVRRWKRAGKTWALVLTMGGVHRGHTKLAKVALQRTDKVVVSIFVNRAQFNREDDYARYPRDLARDVAAFFTQGVHSFFTPDENEVYPGELEQYTPLSVGDKGRGLCGAFRPGHLEGVVSVLYRIFTALRPDIAVFGKKDYQQLMVVRDMVARYALPIKIVGVDTVRETDGLAMSSRNTCLTPQQRRVAPMFYKTLRTLSDSISGLLTSFEEKRKQALRDLEKAGLRPEYIEIRNSCDFSSILREDDDVIILAAAWLGNVRLIDNVQVRHRPSYHTCSG